MNPFEQVETPESLSKVLEGAITRELTAQDAEASHIAAEIQVDIDAPELELAHLGLDEFTAKHAEREKRVAVAREEGRGRLEELQRELEDVKRKLDVINAPILALPNEITEEFFSWHRLMGGNLKTILLVCKRWTTVAYNSPRLWSRIAVTDLEPDKIRLQGALICYKVTHLRWVLSHAKDSPLQLEISFNDQSHFDIGVVDDNVDDNVDNETSLSSDPCGDDCIGLILNTQILKRCTSIVLGGCSSSVHFDGSPMGVKNMTILLKILLSCTAFPFPLRSVRACCGCGQSSRSI